MNLHSIRNEYKYSELAENNISDDPFRQFEHWLNDALTAKVNEPTAMSVATIDSNGFPDSRIVLLKDFGENGFIFFTNYNSNKGKSITQNPKTGLHFFWPELERQIRITGIAEKTSEIVSDKYFHTRPVTSQIAAIISEQSKKIPSRDFLLDLYKSVQEKNGISEIKRPDYWGGYTIKPTKFEFWQGRENRLHDRILYEKTEKGWVISRLAP